MGRLILYLVRNANPGRLDHTSPVIQRCTCGHSFTGYSLSRASDCYRKSVSVDDYFWTIDLRELTARCTFVILVLEEDVRFVGQDISQPARQYKIARGYALKLTSMLRVLASSFSPKSDWMGCKFDFDHLQNDQDIKPPILLIRIDSLSAMVLILLP